MEQVVGSVKNETYCKREKMALDRKFVGSQQRSPTSPWTEDIKIRSLMFSHFVRSWFSDLKIVDTQYDFR